MVLGSFHLRKSTAAFSPQLWVSPRMKGQRGEVGDRQVANECERDLKEGRCLQRSQRPGPALFILSSLCGSERSLYPSMPSPPRPPDERGVPLAAPSSPANLSSLVKSGRRRRWPEGATPRPRVFCFRSRWEAALGMTGWGRLP